ncbi:arylsulfatase-like protein [Schizothecium vesticola]|uniref:Arylsulfatase n=1 Tax=Schizothecium vesticola TaxID=314040 RepID=A0AA40F2N0_9PEZI|nr:arylsulfatase-like protein [Schizothecium vesticola]
MRATSVLLGLHLALAVAYENNNNQKPLGNPRPNPKKKQPNIVFILTDDQDLHMNSLDYMPLTKKHLIDQGTFYKQHYCTTAICCPSRVSLWTGKQAHNTNVTDVSPPYGGYPKFVSQGFNSAYLPVWLQNAGYNTLYTGKLFNAHTTTNYDSPFPGGWNTSDFLLDPYTYDYLNATYQRNHDPPVSHPGQHTLDLITAKALSLLTSVAASPSPFFLGIAPVAPHSNVDASSLTSPDANISTVQFTPPIPLARHAHLFPDARVPRTPNFNPASGPSGTSWIRRLRHQGEDNVEFNDHFYRQRLRALQGVDELVDAVVRRLDALGLLEETYVFYTTDNGFHIGQHRLQPGKECGFEEDVHVPLVVRGPGVPKGREVEGVVTTHVDLAPTLLGIARGEGDGLEFDGEAIPLTGEDVDAARGRRHEHVAVEFWGLALNEGKTWGGEEERVALNNTYKGARVVGEGYSFYYSVWCSNERELYDLTTDPYQLRNLLHPDEKAHVPATILGVSFDKVVARLDSLLFVLKSCKGTTCTRPWHALHPAGNVLNLKDALAVRFDDFYLTQQKRVSFDRCELGYIVDAEGPQFEKDGFAYRQGTPWYEWV